MKQSIVFAFYKNGELIGYRLDTCGSIGMRNPKIYGYSREQVDIVLKNIDFNVLNPSGIGDVLLQVAGESPEAHAVADREKEINQLLQDKKVFEVRVLKCPDLVFEKEFDVQKAEWFTNAFPTYPTEEMEIWLANSEDHEIIETHYFSMDGKINLS